MYSIAQAVNHDTKEAAITVRRLESSHFKKVGTNSWVDSNYPNKEFFVVVQADERARADFIAHNLSFLLQSNGYTIVTVKGNFNDE
jgi:hypothetical protein